MNCFCSLVSSIQRGEEGENYDCDNFALSLSLTHSPFLLHENEAQYKELDLQSTSGYLGVSLASSCDILLPTQTPAWSEAREIGGDDGVRSSSLGSGYSGLLTSVYGGTSLIDFPHYFHVKQMAWPWVPLRKRQCYNRCDFSCISPYPPPVLSPALLLTSYAHRSWIPLLEPCIQLPPPPWVGVKLNCKLQNTHITNELRHFSPITNHRASSLWASCLVFPASIASLFVSKVLRGRVP